MPKIEITEDGSHTLFSEMAGQTYHSSHGAIQESQYIFISQLGGIALDEQNPKSSPKLGEVLEEGRGMFNSQLSILEIGFGTGLNALLTAKWAEEHCVHIDYTTIELYPLAEEVYSQLNYGEIVGCEELFLQLHKAQWDAGLQPITEYFSIQKCKNDIVEELKIRSREQGIGNKELGVRSVTLYSPPVLGGVPEGGGGLFNSQFSTFNSQFNIVYFDAFSPDAQPELWTEEVFANVYQLMHSGGVMTTYCAKGDVRRAMLAAGFKVEKLQGPPGKRHILRATKYKQ